MKRSIIATLAAAAGLLVLGLLVVRSVKKFVIDSEYEVRAMHAAGMLLEKYVSTHRAWPSGWPDLATVTSADVLARQYNVDFKKMHQFVEIDFSFDMCKGLHEAGSAPVKSVNNYYAYPREDPAFTSLLITITKACSNELDNKEVGTSEPTPPKNE